MAIPITANPALASLLDWYCAQRVAYCEKMYNNPPATAVRSFAPYEKSGDWQANATLSVKILDACTAIGDALPKGFKLTLHILRKGAARCIGTPLHVVKYMGGWAKNGSEIESKYIDPTMTPTQAAWRYFG
jgi:hypothetical protein